MLDTFSLPIAMPSDPRKPYLQSNYSWRKSCLKHCWWIFPPIPLPPHPPLPPSSPHEHLTHVLMEWCVFLNPSLCPLICLLVCKYTKIMYINQHCEFVSSKMSQQIRIKCNVKAVKSEEVLFMAKKKWSFNIKVYIVLEKFCFRDCHSFKK